MIVTTWLHCCPTGFGGDSSPTDTGNSGEGTRLAIGVGIAAALVVVLLIVTLLYFLRFVKCFYLCSLSPDLVTSATLSKKTAG